MTLLQLEQELGKRGLGGITLNMWDNQTRMWTATTRGESAPGKSLSEAVLNLLDKFPPLEQGAVP